MAVAHVRLCKGTNGMAGLVFRETRQWLIRNSGCSQVLSYGHIHEAIVPSATRTCWYTVSSILRTHACKLVRKTLLSALL
jgi:hypothetical protein